MEFFRNVYLEFGHYLIAPFVEPQMWWIIGPVFVVMFVLSLYFATHDTEKLGWNTSLTNSAVLIFIGLDLFRHIYNYTSPASFTNFMDHQYKILIILIVMIEGFILSYSAFSHSLPEKIMFFVASPLVINVQIYVLIVLVYLQVDPTRYTIFAALTLFMFLFVIFGLVSKFTKRHIALSEDGIVAPIVQEASTDEEESDDENLTEPSVETESKQNI